MIRSGALTAAGRAPRAPMPKVVPEYKAQARARIVEAAATVFRRRGLPGGTMDEIAREIGVSKGALYLYFPTKSQLLAAVQATFREHYLGVLERRLARGDVAEGIVAALDGVLTREFEPAVWHQLMTDAATDPEVRAALRADEREDRKALRALLRRLAGEGRIPPMRDPDSTVDALLLVLHGALTSVTLRGEAGATRVQLLRALRLVLGTAEVRRRTGRARA